MKDLYHPGMVKGKLRYEEIVSPRTKERIARDRAGLMDFVVQELQRICAVRHTGVQTTWYYEGGMIS